MVVAALLFLADREGGMRKFLALADLRAVFLASLYGTPRCSSANRAMTTAFEAFTREEDVVFRWVVPMD